MQRIMLIKNDEDEVRSEESTENSRNADHGHGSNPFGGKKRSNNWREVQDHIGNLWYIFYVSSTIEDFLVIFIL
jgi:hypothetical protein